MIFVTDASGQTIHASAEWEALTGRRVSEALGMRWLRFVHPEDRGIVSETLDRALRQIAEFRIRYRLVKPDGGYRWVSAGGIPSMGPPDRTFIGYFGSLIEREGGAEDGDGRGAFGEVSPLTATLEHSTGMTTDRLDQAADHLVRAYALIETEGSGAALLGLRQALYEIGRALADRERVEGLPH